MTRGPFIPSRRLFLRSGLSLGAVALAVPALLADGKARTPDLTEGPFYPDRLPLDKDNDLLRIGKDGKLAEGEITHLTGKILDTNGKPIKDATIEIWQVDAHGVYLNTRDSGQKQDQQDKNFQGYGTFTTGSTGEYRFRTIKPVPYPGRTPHIHYKVSKGGRELLTSQIFVGGHPQNDRDGILGDLGLIDRELVTADFKPVKGSKAGELAASFEIVLGRTPDERDPAPRRRR